MINTSKLKGRMVEKGITQKQMAEMLGIAAPTVCQKLNKANGFIRGRDTNAYLGHKAR